MSTLPTLPDRLVKRLDEVYDFKFNAAEGDYTPAVETTLDEDGLHVYGSGEAVLEFFIMLGHAASDDLPTLIDLTEGARLHGNDITGDVDVELPKFLVDKKGFASDAV